MLTTAKIGNRAKNTIKVKIKNKHTKTPFAFGIQVQIFLWSIFFKNKPRRWKGPMSMKMISIIGNAGMNIAFFFQYLDVRTLLLLKST